MPPVSDLCVLDFIPNAAVLGLLAVARPLISAEKLLSDLAAACAVFARGCYSRVDEAAKPRH